MTAPQDNEQDAEDLIAAEMAGLDDELKGLDEARLKDLDSEHHEMRLASRSGSEQTYVCDRCSRVLVFKLDPPELVVLDHGDFAVTHSGGNVQLPGLEVAVTAHTTTRWVPCSTSASCPVNT